MTHCFTIIYYLATSFGPECGPLSGHYKRTWKCTENLSTMAWWCPTFKAKTSYQETSHCYTKEDVSHKDYLC